MASRHVPLSELVTGRYRGRLALMVAFQFLQTFGYFGFLIWAPTILVKEGFVLVHALFYVALTMILGPVGAFIGALFVERWERKWAIATLAAGIAVFGLAFAVSRSPVLIVLNGGLVTLLSNWFVAAFHPYQAEIFPTRLRATAGGFAYAWSRFGVAVSAPVIGFILMTFGVVGVFTVIAVAMLLITVIIGAFGPRTNSLALEVIAE
ncbi:MAG: MFS transporter [Rhodospirillales bacterium]|nr:MFS transporter [Rhodospirillales bacterium]